MVRAVSVWNKTEKFESHHYPPGAPARVFYQYFPFLVILWSVGLPTEWNRWIFPIRSMLLPRLIHPVVLTEAPFFSTLKASEGRQPFVSEFNRG